MIGFVFAGLIALFAAIEIISIRQADCLSVTCEVDKTLVEPDEVNTLCYTVRSRSRLPLLFVGIAVYFEDGIRICEDEEFCRKYVSTSLFSTNMSRHLNFVPHGRYQSTVRFSVGKRGIHPVGQFYVETMDFFGLKSIISSSEIDCRIICTAKNADDDVQVTTLGSYLGDISVRRFIFEDPNLLIGYREYTGHEPMKKISWIQTAKTGDMMVKLNDFTVDINVAVVVNMERWRDPEMEHCLELTRSACEVLEQEKIPYALITNGDLGNLSEGLGRRHIHTILRKIGVARPAGYNSFASLVDYCIRTNRENRSYIVITPTPDEDDKAQLSLLQQHSDTELCILYGGEDNHERSDSDTHRS